MKRILLKIIVITLITIALLPFSSIYAAEAGLSATGATIGGTISATISIPDGARGYSAVVSITYSDGTTSSTPIGSANTVGNLTPEQLTRTVTFPASTIGNATITVSKLLISDENRNQMNSNTTLSTTVQIQDNSTPEPPVQTEDPNESNESNEPEETVQPTPEPKFTSVNDTVYVKSRVNVRESYTTSSKSYGLLDVGTKLTRTGIGNNGWTRVKYNGGEAYIYSSYLTDEEPVATMEPTPTPTEEPTPSPSSTPDENDEDKDKKAYEKIVKAVGVLPEVGNNVAKYLYVAIVIIALIGIVVINKIYKGRE